MTNGRIYLVTFLMILLLAACEGEPTVVELPTLVVLPSLTPSDTPTPTQTPTSTPTSTPTDTPTNTSTPTPTSTFTPRATFTPSLTWTPSITPTYTPTLTSTPTNTPVATNTPNAPQVISFSSNATSVAANTQITLSWNTVSDTVRIDQLNQQGIVVQSFSVVPVGTLPVVVPGSTKLTVYRLVALRGGMEASQSISITVQCSTGWFFGDQYAPPEAGCPTAVGAKGPGAFQPYERGFFIYVNANGLNTIYGLTSSDSRFISYPNGWDGSTVYACNGKPPSGLFAPTAMFDWMYCRTNPPIAVQGGWGISIGLGTTTVNNDDRTIQYEDGTGVVYIDSPVGVFRFVPSTGLYSKIT